MNQYLFLVVSNWDMVTIKIINRESGVVENSFDVEGFNSRYLFRKLYYAFLYSKKLSYGYRILIVAVIGLKTLNCYSII